MSFLNQKIPKLYHFYFWFCIQRFKFYTPEAGMTANKSSRNYMAPVCMHFEHETLKA